MSVAGALRDRTEVEQLRTQLSAQRATLSGLRDALAAAAAARDAAAADLRSLEYVSGLTRDEAERRRRGNQHVLAAGTSLDENHADAGPELQLAETKLLAAKTELAALRLSVDELVARMRSRASVRTTPRTPPASFARLIADVDVIASAGAADAAAPARLGVTPAGAVALFGYHSPEPVHRFSAALRVSKPVPLSERDERVLKQFLEVARVSVAESGPAGPLEEQRALICGVREALRGTVGIVNSMSAAPNVFEDPLPPQSPRRGGRTFD